MAVWHMTEPNVTDSTSYQNNGTESGGVTFNSSGKIDGADRFYGTSDYITVPSDSSLQLGTGNITLSLWIKALNNISGTSVSGFVDKGSGSGLEGYWFWYRWSSQSLAFRFELDNDSLQYYYSDNNLNISDGEWHQAVVTLDRGYGTYFYFDGASAGTSAKNFYHILPFLFLPCKLRLVIQGGA